MVINDVIDLAMPFGLLLASHAIINQTNSINAKRASASKKPKNNKSRGSAQRGGNGEHGDNERCALCHMQGGGGSAHEQAQHTRQQLINQFQGLTESLKMLLAKY